MALPTSNEDSASQTPPAAAPHQPPLEGPPVPPMVHPRVDDDQVLRWLRVLGGRSRITHNG
jgi:hypothetical protein